MRFGIRVHARETATAALLALATACVPQSDGYVPNPFVSDGSSARLEGPPRRVVVDGAMIIGGGPDAPMPPPPDDALAAPTPDAPAASRDVALPDSTPDTTTDRTSTDAMDCDIVAQNCPNRAQACYRGALGRGRCMLAGLAGLGSACQSDQICDRGLLCVVTGALFSAFCHDICGPGMACPGRQMCLPLPGFANAGYCEL